MQVRKMLLKFSHSKMVYEILKLTYIQLHWHCCLDNPRPQWHHPVDYRTIFSIPLFSLPRAPLA